MSDYMVSRKRKRHVIDPCLGLYLLSGGKVILSPSSRSNNSPSSGHEDTLVQSSIENKRGSEGICDVSHIQYLENLPDPTLQRTPECGRRMQPQNPGYENLNSSDSVVSDPGQLMMTVEDFLKRSNKRKDVVKKQYGKKKRRIKRLGDDGALFEAERRYGISGSDPASGDTSQAFMQLRSKKIRRATLYESSSDESSSRNHKSSSPVTIKKNKNLGRTTKSLKERLYEAAVLTHGNPDDILVHGATTGSEGAPSRRPLRFIPETQLEPNDSQMDKRRPRTWSLVDPRKSMAIRTASFSSKIRPYPQHMDSPASVKTANLSVQPPKRWKFAVASLAHSSLGILKSNRQPKILAVKAYEYPPLAFVSLKEAEEDYKSMFSSDNHERAGRLRDVCTTSTLQMVSVAQTVSHVEGRISNPAVPTHNVDMVPLEEVIHRSNFAIEASAQVAVDESRTLDKSNDMLPSASLDSSPIINSISSPTALAPPVTPQNAQDRPITRMAPARHGNSRANVKEDALIRRGSDVTSKPMRPLASFFNEFIQNIRNVTVSQDQPSSSDKHLVFKRPLRKASRNGEPFDKHPLRPLDNFTCSTSCLQVIQHNPRQCDINIMLLRPAATNLTDMTEGIFVSQQAWTTDLESIRQNDPSFRDHMNRQWTAQRLSPDILTVLEPQNYQVILSSPSVS